MSELKLKYLSKCDEQIKYNEVPNWFVSLKVDEEVCWGLYDGGLRDYAYHVNVTNKINVHEKE